VNCGILTQKSVKNKQPNEQFSPCTFLKGMNQTLNKLAKYFLLKNTTTTIINKNDIENTGRNSNMKRDNSNQNTSLTQWHQILQRS
jgi:hypothetical protein